MVTRFYFENADITPQVTPSSWSAGWNSTGVATRSFYPNRKRAGGLANLTGTGPGVSGNTISFCRWVFGPLAKQTIAGTVKGQQRCLETNTTDNYRLAVAIKVVKYDGTDRGILLAVTQSGDTTNTPPEFATGTGTNRRFRDGSENTSIALSAVDCSDGDYLVVELGLKAQSTSVASATFRTGSAAASDLSEDDTSTADNNPWIEFSETITYTPYFWNSASNPADNGTLTEPQTGAAITPPTNMLAGDFVFVEAHLEGSVGTDLDSVVVNATGGQTWTTHNSANSRTRAFSCKFNGTWSVNPSWDAPSLSGTHPFTLVMHVFVPNGSNNTPSISAGPNGQNYTAPASPFDVTMGDSGSSTPISGETLYIMVTTSDDDNSWTVTTSGATAYPWRTFPTAQYRNLGGADHSMTFAWMSLTYERDQIGGATPSAIDTATARQTVNGGDAGTNSRYRYVFFYGHPYLQPYDNIHHHLRRR